MPAAQASQVYIPSTLRVDHTFHLEGIRLAHHRLLKQLSCVAQYPRQALKRHLYMSPPVLHEADIPDPEVLFDWVRSYVPSVEPLSLASRDNLSRVLGSLIQFRPFWDFTIPIAPPRLAMEEESSSTLPCVLPQQSLCDPYGSESDNDSYIFDDSCSESDSLQVE